MGYFTCLCSCYVLTWVCIWLNSHLSLDQLYFTSREPQVAHGHHIGQLRFSQKLHCGTDLWKHRGLWRQVGLIPKSVCPVLAAVGGRKPLVGAVVEGKWFSHTRVGDSNKEGMLGRWHLSSALEVEWGLHQVVRMEKGTLGRVCSLGRGPGFWKSPCSWRATGSPFSLARVLGVGALVKGQAGWSWTCHHWLPLPPASLTWVTGSGLLTSLPFLPCSPSPHQSKCKSDNVTPLLKILSGFSQSRNVRVLVGSACTSPWSSLLERSPLAILASFPCPKASTLAFLSAWKCLARMFQWLTLTLHISATQFPSLQRAPPVCHPVQNKTVPFASFVQRRCHQLGQHVRLCCRPLPWDVGPKRAGVCLFCSLSSAWCSAGMCWMNNWMNKWTKPERYQTFKCMSIRDFCWSLCLYLFSLALYLEKIQIFKKVERIVQWLSMYLPLRLTCC